MASANPNPRTGGVLDVNGDFTINGWWNFVAPPAQIYTPVNVSTLVLSGHQPGAYMLSKSTGVTVTIGAPTAGIDDGTMIVFDSDAAVSHTVTFTGSTLDTGSAAALSVTFNPFKGAGFAVFAYNGRWKIADPIAVSFS